MREPAGTGGTLLGELWRLASSAVLERVGDSSEAQLFKPASRAVIRMPSNEKQPAPTGLPLRLFQGQCFPVDAAQTTPKPGVASVGLLSEWAGFTGGRIRALEWCPTSLVQVARSQGTPGGSKRRKTGQAWRHLAVCPYPCGEPPQSGTAVQRGAGMLQIWRVAVPKAVASRAAAPPLCVEMYLGLLHGGRVTWDLAWCPAPAAEAPWCGSAAPSCSPMLGLLAAVHGDGRVAVYGVPDAGTVDATAGPLVLRPEPTLAADLGEMMDCMPSCVSWLPIAPFDLLAVGCWGGQVVVLRCNPDCGEGRLLEPLATMMGSAFPIRSIAFPPAGEVAEAEDGADRNTVAVAGDEGRVVVWDIRDVFTPVFEGPSSHKGITAMSWVEGLQFLLTCDDGTAGLSEPKGPVPPRFVVVAVYQPAQAPLLSCHVTPERPSNRMMAFSGEDGRVCVARVPTVVGETRKINKSKKAGARHRVTAVSSMAKQGTAMALMGPRELSTAEAAEPPTLHSQAEKVAALFPDEEIAVPAVRWCPANHRGPEDDPPPCTTRLAAADPDDDDDEAPTEPALFFLASGSGAGLLRVQLLRLPS
eukprot:jgi/Tetstr1/421052/TSEL_012097.t1